jgi:hypothetical protein
MFNHFSPMSYKRVTIESEEEEEEEEEEEVKKRSGIERERERGTEARNHFQKHTISFAYTHTCRVIGVALHRFEAVVKNQDAHTTITTSAPE